MAREANPSGESRGGSRVDANHTLSGGLPRVAYLCMEFGLSEELPLYAGGLGILAGDVLRAAHDLGYPMVGVGILWRQGYTYQIVQDGHVIDASPTYDRVKSLLEDTGVEVTLFIRRRPVRVKVWRLSGLGNVPLYLLDTFVPGNADRWITARLYEGYPEQRVAQEMVLGVGAVRALEALGIPVDLYHLNEGHGVFAGIELIRQEMARGRGFAEAWEAARRRIVFTTHTPVREGNEAHPLDLLEYMGACDGLNRRQMERIGGQPFQMTVAALRLSRVANAVSHLHGETARRMWAGVTRAAPILAITNGVHVPTWQDPAIARAMAAGERDLWAAHTALKRDLLAFVRERTGVQLREDRLLVGFARRAAAYKRADLIFRSPERIEPYLREGRIQILFAGKSHPQDDMGRQIVANLLAWSRRYPESVVFLPNYDMEMGRRLTRGSDIWLNNPRRPLEASGTSGMKAAMNGVLNVSVLDGWWPEACRHGVNGWQIGGGYEGPDADSHDAASLYQVLLEEVLPCYEQDRARWVQMMRASIADTVERFSARRMLLDYLRELYGGKPAAGVPSGGAARLVEGAAAGAARGGAEPGQPG